MKEKLQTQIQELHDLLENSSFDQVSSENIRRVSEDLSVSLISGNSDINRAFGEELEQEALTFAEEHPAITQVIREIIRTLHNAGI